MSWLADKLTAKAVQGIAAALLVLSLGLGAQVWVQGKRLDVAQADKKAAESARHAAVTERESWKSKAEDALAANRAYDVILAQLEEAAAEQQRLSDEAASRAATQVAAARRDEAKAERENEAFRRLFGNKPKDCEAALQALDRVCPMLGGY